MHFVLNIQHFLLTADRKNGYSIVNVLFMTRNAAKERPTQTVEPVSQQRAGVRDG
jgi:hypothetical protein